MTWINELDAAIRELLGWASTVNPWLCVLAVLVVLSVETSLLLGLLVPGEAALLLAVGALGARWAVPLFFAALLANVIGQSGGYWLGRLLGPGIRDTWIGHKVGPQRWERAESIVRGSGARALITTRFIAFVHAVVPVVVGCLRLPFRRFIGLATIGATVWAAVFTGVAVLLGEAAKVVGYGWMTLACTLLGGSAAVLTLYRAAKRRDSAPEVPPEQNP